MSHYYAQAFQLLYDAVIVTDTVGNVVDCNPGAERLYGYSRKEMLDQSVDVLFSEDPESDVSPAEIIVSKIMKNGFWSGELPRFGRKNNHGWVEAYVVPLKDDAGEMYGALGVSRDITARKRQEDTPANVDGRWRSLFEHAPDGVILTDTAGTITLVNKAVEVIFGYSSDELVGQNVDVLVPTASRYEHAGYREFFTAAPNSVRMGKGRDIKGQRKDGSVVALQVGLSSFMVDGELSVIATVHDQTQHNLLINELEIQSTAVKAAASGIAISNLKGICEWINPAFTKITGYEPEDIIGKPISTLKSNIHDDAFFADLWKTISAGDVWRGEIVNRHKAGHLYTEEQTIAPVKDAEGNILRFIAVKMNISARKQMEVQILEANRELAAQLKQIEALQDDLREQAIRDPLTGLYNRRYLADALEREVARARRTSEPLSAVAIDLDNFKAINDTYGHPVGDKVLIKFANMLQETIRKSDIAVRMGGDEFLVLLPNGTPEGVCERAAEWQNQFADCMSEMKMSEEGCTISIGITTLRDEAKDSEALLSRADKALYEAKSSGRNQTVILE